MSEESNESLKEKTLYRRRTVMGAIAAGAGLSAAGGVHAQQDQDDEGVGENWVPPEASEAHVAVLTGQQAQEMSGGGCAHITPQERDTLAVDVLIEDIQCVTQAHIHEGERGDDGPIVAPLFEYTDEPDGSGEGDPITTTPETPLIEGTTVDDPELVDDILADPSQYYVNVHTTHNPEGEIRGQIRGFDLGQETDLEPQPAEFRVTNLDPVEATVKQGDRIDVSATVRNAGDITETQTIEFRIDGEVIDQQTLELGCRQSRTITFEDIDTADLEPGEYTHGVFSEDDSATGTLTITELDPAKFMVSDLDPVEATVMQGDGIDVSATIENVGEQEGTQTLELRIDEELDPEEFVTVHSEEDDDETDDDENEFLVVIEQELTLGPDEEEEIVFEDIETEELDPGDYEHGIFSQDDSETGTLTIEPVPPAEFIVTDLDPAEATVTQGDVIDVSATVTNEGEMEGTQDIELRIDEELDPDDFVTANDDTDADQFAFLDSQSLTLDPDESETVTFENVDTEALEPGDYEHGIFSENDSETGTLTVEGISPAEFSVLDLDPVDVTVTQGELIDVQATIENTGEEEGTQTVEFRVDGDPLADEELTLDAGDSELVIFTDIDTGPLDPGEYEHGVFTDDDEATGTLTVEEEEVLAAEFTVSGLDPMDVSVTQGEIIDVSATIENVGGEEGTQTVEFRVDGDPLADEELTLDADESELVIFTDIDTSPLDPGEYEHGIFTDDDSQTATLTIEEEEVVTAEFTVSDLDPMDVSVTQGDIIDVQATIMNEGGESGTQTVEFRVDGDPLADEELTLDADESELVIFSDIDTSPLEPGDYEHGIFTDDDSQTATLTVEAEENGNGEGENNA